MSPRKVLYQVINPHWPNLYRIKRKIKGRWIGIEMDLWGHENIPRINTIPHPDFVFPSLPRHWSPRQQRRHAWPSHAEEVPASEPFDVNFTYHGYLDSFNSLLYHYDKMRIWLGYKVMVMVLTLLANCGSQHDKNNSHHKFLNLYKLCPWKLARGDDNSNNW